MYTDRFGLLFDFYNALMFIACITFYDDDDDDDATVGVPHTGCPSIRPFVARWLVST